MPGPARPFSKPEETSGSEAWRNTSLGLEETWAGAAPGFGTEAVPDQWRDPALSQASSSINDLLYLFACQIEWERNADPSAAWEVISAARSSHADARAPAHSLLEHFQQVGSQTQEIPPEPEYRQNSTMEPGKQTPFTVAIIGSSQGGHARPTAFFFPLFPTLLIAHYVLVPSA